MKRAFVSIVALLVAMMVITCATSGGPSGSSGTPERKVGGGIPQFVKDALKSVPEDALIGIGTAKMGTLSLSRTAATTRARAEISRQMNTMIRDMVRDYTASSEVDPSATVSFTENITTALSESKLQGATSVMEDTDEQGNYWVVVMLSKTSTVAEINQAQAAAKLAVPAMLSFNAEDRMNEAFAKAAGSEVGFSDR
jgi:hypothetical protein